MNARQLLSGVGTALLVVVVVALLFGQLLGQPILLGYVQTGSMAPTMEPGDGFVAVPSALAGEPGPGDVVVFEAETIQGGGLTTHRVVRETDRGYVTKGDANPFTDQDGGEPYVSEQDIVAHALQVNGKTVVLPYLGTAVSGVRSVLTAPLGWLGAGQSGSVLVFAGIALFVLAGATGDRRSTSRSVDREQVVAVWAIILFATLVVTMAATAAMVLPANAYEVDLVVTDDPEANTQIVAPGGTGSVTYEVHNAGVVPALIVTESPDEGVAVEPRDAVLGFDGRTEVTVLMDAPEETGEYTRTVSESRYLLVLPRGVLLALHSVHPWLALFAVDLVVATFVVALSIAVFGTGYLRLRPSADVPLKIRIRRRLRSLR